MSGRIERLRANLDEPLLVTDPINVRYLTGFVSSNPALLVEPDRVRLFSDFRYAEAGSRVEGIEFTVAKRNLVADLAERLSGRIAFEADAVTYAAYETLSSGALELVPRRGLVEALRAVKDDGELELIRRAAEITSEAFERLAGERVTERTERDLAWSMDQLFHELGGGTGLPTGRSSRRGRTGPCRMPCPATGRSKRERRSWSTRPRPSAVTPATAPAPLRPGRSRTG